MRALHIYSLLAVIPAIACSINGHYQQQVLQTAQCDRPNVVFILTDDQDTHLNSLDYMPHVKRHLLDQGTHFTKHYCTTAVCCPSRATLWTGKQSHNTNITDVSPPYGGYLKFVENGFNDKYLPVWLQQAGYNTYYTGKLFNAHSVNNYDDPVPAGFTNSDFLLDPFTYNYLNSTFQRKGEQPKSYEGRYSTDIVAQKAQDLLQDAVADGKPFFLTIAPIAPHGNIYMNRSSSGLGKEPMLGHSAPVSAERHEHLFQDVKVPRTENFNPDVPSGANWLLDLPQQTQENIDYNDHYHRQRLRSLQAVDELVDNIFVALDDYGILNNTYVLYSSDNGFHIGQHRLQPGKSCGYEEDINVPLIVRGPGVAANYTTTDIVTTHTDLAPTFFKLLGIPTREDFDGTAIPVEREGIEAVAQRRREHVAVEYWGYAGGEGIFDSKYSFHLINHLRLTVIETLHENNTYKAIRIAGPGYNIYYSIWCTNERELYDMSVDPGQMHNLFPVISSTISIAGHSLSKVVSRLDSLLLVLKSCSGKVCREPWKSLHPAGDVETLQDALVEEYDEFYELQQTTRVEFDYCWNGYVPEAEGPMWETHGVAFVRDGLPWYDWV
ncbi:hypothetical protein N7540_000279 [Penicillium herquei]|nr:hypothetical protein N7540_000279 [Penicillium herquei]